MNLNSPPSPYEDHDRYNQSDHATSAFSCHIFFDESPSRTYQLQHQEDEGCVSYRGGSNEAIKMDDDRLKLSLVWKRDQDKGITLSEHNHVRQTRVIEDTKYTGHKSLKIKSNYIQEFEDHKRLQYSFPSESTELSSNTTSYNNNATSYNNNNDNNRIRVCADCNTTKTPLWRSGPQGPKSLCNACGIRQRKARRAMAIAAAATVGTPPRTEAPPSMKIKVHQKEKISKKRHTNVEKKIKKKKKLGFEEFLINLNKELAFHRVFPQDEKEAAILLMALSSGLLHS